MPVKMGASINIRPNRAGRNLLIHNLEATTEQIGKAVLRRAKGRGAGAAPIGRGAMSDAERPWNQKRGDQLRPSQKLRVRPGQINPTTLRGRGPRAIISSPLIYAKWVYEGTPAHQTSHDHPMVSAQQEATIPAGAQKALDQVVTLTTRGTRSHGRFMRGEQLTETFQGMQVREQGGGFLTFYATRRRGQEANPWMRTAYNLGARSVIGQIKGFATSDNITLR